MSSGRATPSSTIRIASSPSARPSRDDAKQGPTGLDPPGRDLSALERARPGSLDGRADVALRVGIGVEHEGLVAGERAETGNSAAHDAGPDDEHSHGLGCYYRISAAP